jgi:hypothetical protein
MLSAAMTTVQRRKQAEKVALKQKQIRLKFVDACQLQTAEERESGNPPECAICYGRINKCALVCSSPCNKFYHQSCLETTIENQETAFFETYEPEDDADEDEEIQAPIRCCYCRREVNTDAYVLDLQLKQLRSLQAGGYEVSESIEKIINANGILPEDEDAFDIEYYTLIDCRRYKKPKTSVRATYKQKQKRPHVMQFKIKQTRNYRK